MKNSKRLIFLETDNVKLVNQIMSLLKNEIISKGAVLEKYADLLWETIVSERENDAKDFLREEMEYLKQHGINVVLKTTEEKLLSYKVTAEEIQRCANHIIERIKKKREQREIAKIEWLQEVTDDNNRTNNIASNTRNVGLKHQDARTGQE
jgi:hypothetical protein